VSFFESLKADVQREFLPKLVLSKPEEFDSIWDQYIAALNRLDVAGYENWYTQKIQAIMAKAQGK